MTNTANYGWSKEALTGEVASFPTRLGSVLDSIDTSLATALASKTTTAMATNAQTGTTYTFVLLDAGKTVTANNVAASAYNIPLESSVPWVANTELRVWNIGAGTVTVTCTSGTLAGTVTIPQYGFVTFKKLGTNTWYGKAEDTAVSSGGLVLINTTTFSAVSSVSLNNVFSSTYENYQIRLEASVAAANADLELRFRVGGVDNSSTNYQAERLYSTSTSVSSSTNPGGDTVIYLTNGSSTYVGSSVIAEICSPQVSQLTKVLARGVGRDSAAVMYNFVTSGMFLATTAFDGFTIRTRAGTTFTGTVRVYGYKNS